MSASEVGVKELLAQKRYHKNSLDRTGTSEKTFCSGKTTKNPGKN